MSIPSVSLISNIKENSDFFFERNLIVSVEGWIKNFRVSKNFCFFDLNDGSCIDDLQVIFSKDNSEFCGAKLGSYIFLTGFLIKKKNSDLKVKEGKIFKYDLKLERILKLKEAIFDNKILQKKQIPLEFVRKYPEFRAKTSLFLSIFKIRSSISKFIHDFFHFNNFFFVSSPLITNIDAEGAGEVFDIFPSTAIFDKNYEKKKLTVSGQLHLEFLVQGLGRVYNFSPCFRAEKSHTIRHLSEFWMIEAEFICSKLSELIYFSENFVKFVIRSILESNYCYLKFIRDKHSNDQKNFLDYLENISKKTFEYKRIKYRDALKLLNNEFNLCLKFGDNFSYEEEKKICDYFKSPVFVTHFPAKSRAFYMMRSDNNEEVECFDLLFPNVGEVIGGSIREDNYDKMKKMKENDKSIKSYVDLRALGYGTTGGFGLGLERLVMFICGINNIQDSIPFPYLI